MTSVAGRRIEYAGSVHDEREIEAVNEVLRGGPTALRIGRHVRAMEARVAELFGKRRGVMCNSGSSALYLAVELLDLEPGDEVVTSAVTFSTDLAPIVRSRRPAPARRPCALADRCLLLRRWGRRSETQLFGSKKGRGERFFSALGDGLEYDNLFIFDEVGWNFEPSELSAAFGLVQLDKLPDNLARRRRNFELTGVQVARWPEHFVPPRTTDGLETAWHMFPLLVRPETGIRRAELQEWMDGHGIDTRMVWTGNAARQPAFARVGLRLPPGGLPRADRVMEQGLVLPNHHGMDDADCHYIGECLESFLVGRGLA